MLQYDGLGDLLALTNPKGARRSFQYKNGILTQTSDWMGNITCLEYDTHGRLTKRIDPTGGIFRYYYDLMGNLVRSVQPDRAQNDAEYDASGNLIRLTDAGGAVRTRWYGPCRRLLRATDADNRSVDYKWGTEPGRLEEIVNERREVYRLVRNLLGEVTDVIGYDGRRLRFKYDLCGRCIRTMNGKGEIVDIERDANGRVIRQNLPGGETVTLTYDAGGNLTDAVNATCSVHLDRDALGRVIREIQGDHWVKYTLDAMGEMSRLETDLGLRIDYTVDDNGRWTGLQTPSGHCIRFSHDARGQEIRRLLPGGLVVDQRHDSVGRLIEQRLSRRNRLDSDLGSAHAGNGYAMVRRSYKRYITGLVNIVEDDAFGVTRYTYSAGDRLLRVAHAHTQSEQFSYDLTGNLTASVRTDARRSMVDEQPLSYGPGNRLLAKGQTRYEYDTQGRLVKKIEQVGSGEPMIWCYEWDALDQLRVVRCPDGQIWKYGYDAFSRRVCKSGHNSEVRFVWSAHVPLHEYSRNEPSWTGYLFEQNTFIPLAKIEKQELYPIITDHLGTPTELIDEEGRILKQIRPTAYGETAPNLLGHRMSCPFRFQGQYYDKESGLHYNRYRYYDPTTARYLQQDPLLLGEAGNPYVYARNPTGWVDPLGLCLSQFLKNKLKRVRNETAAGGNRGISGSVTPEEARQLGEAFVGPNFRETSTDSGTPILLSEDGLRQFRGPSEKSGVNPLTAEPYSRTGTQVNFQSRPEAAGPYTSNVHLDVDT